MEHKWGPLEEGINLSVIAAGRGNCQRCGETTMVFTCDLFRERAIEELCQGCAVHRAGGVAKIYVRSGEYLRRKWERNAPLECRVPPKRGVTGGSRRAD